MSGHVCDDVRGIYRCRSLITWLWGNQKGDYPGGPAPIRCRFERRGRLEEMGCWWPCEGAHCHVAGKDPSTAFSELSAVPVNSLLQKLRGGEAGPSSCNHKDTNPQTLEWTWKGPLHEDGTNDTLISALWDSQQRIQLRHAGLLTHSDCDIIHCVVLSSSGCGGLLCSSRYLEHGVTISRFLPSELGDKAQKRTECWSLLAYCKDHPCYQILHFPVNEKASLSLLVILIKYTFTNLCS